MTVLFDVLVRSSIVLAAGLLIAASLRRRSAALRHAVLVAAVFAAAAVVPLSLLVPAWEIPLPAASPAATSAARTEITARVLSGSVVAAPVLPTSSSASPLALIWFGGFLAMSATLMTGIVRLRRVAARARRVCDARWTGIAADVAAGYGLSREIVVLQTDSANLLATWGCRRPRVLLPSHARRWSLDRLNVVLAHEFAHIRRHDWLVQITVEVLRTIVWFNPLMWIACTRLRRESEQACDDAVLGRGVAASDYAAHLLELARMCRRPHFPWASAMPMAHPSMLERRITAMLNPQLNRQALSRRGLITIAALLVAVALPAATLRAVQAPDTLSGSIYDATGAVLPGVALTLEDAHEFKWSATTNASGQFQFPRIPAGRYTLSAELPGFKALRHEFELKNARDWDRAITLQVGSLTESIFVQASRLAPPPPPARAVAPAPIRVGGNIRIPRKLQDVKPVYPDAMRAAGREGVVPIEAIIGVDGKVISVRVTTAQVHPDFAIAAVDAVRQWLFSPTLLNGKPVEVVMTVTVDFKLGD
jgi:TonB family protein